MTHYDYALVGGGMAAQAALSSIREHDPNGRIGWFLGERYPAYRRPPLSKGLWDGTDPESIWYEPPGRDVDVHLSCPIVALDPTRKRLRSSTGDEHSFDRLLLATGGTPRRLPDASQQVVYFRTLDDYRRLRLLARRPLRFAVIGGGFIGTEIAAALKKHGRDVTMIVPQEGIGSRMFPADLASYLVRYYREQGVEMWMGQRVESVREAGSVLVVHTSAGKTLNVDVVVAGLGLQPNVELAFDAGLAVENGISVNEYLETSHPDIFAAGDVASVTAPVLCDQRRFEHEDAAVSMGKTAGRNMAGHRQPYRHLPFFYSDLFAHGYEAVGDLDARHQTVADWTTPFEKGVVYYLDRRRVRGVLLWNVWGQVEGARALLENPALLSADVLQAGALVLPRARAS